MTLEIDTTSDELLKQFEWYFQNFDGAFQSAFNDFLLEGIKCKLISLSKNVNFLFQNESYFVTKIKINAQDEIYIRVSDKAVNAILTKALGVGAVKKFDINKMTDLEAKMITAFNDNLYNFVNEVFDKNAQVSKNFDITHLTFLISDDKSNLCGKVIVSFPSQLVMPMNVVCNEQKFSNDYFANSLVDVNIKIGTTAFSVGELKSLEVEDIIVLDNSNIQTMQLSYNGYEKDFSITPNPALIISVDNSEGEEIDMNTPPQNLWDSIQVEMGAEFDKVKISLGELKNIEQGLVVDIGSVYNNNVTLKLEDRVIAMGELVIVNDRYGVKINQIFTEPKEQPQYGEQIPQIQNEQDSIGEPMESYGEQIPQEEYVGEQQDSAEEFDYSDFELDDEDI